MYLFISSQFENHTIGFSQSSGLSTIMEFPFSSALLLLLTLLCLLNIGEVSFNVVGLKYIYLSIFKLHKSISLPLPPCFKKKKKQILDLLLFGQTTYKRADFCYRHTGHNILLPSSYLSYSINQFCHQSVQEMWAFCDLYCRRPLSSLERRQQR